MNVSKFTATTSAVLGPSNFSMLYWLNPQNIGDTLVLEDASGNEVVTLRCEVANQSQVFNWPGHGFRTNGYQIATLASGSAYLYTT